MTAAQLIRLSGLASIVAGVLIAISEIVVQNLGLMSMHLMETAPAGPYWVPFMTMELIGLLFMLLALVGLYALQAAVAGVFGLVAFVAAFFGTALVVGAAFENAYTPPVLARLAPDLLHMMPPPSPIGESFILAVVASGVGLVLFGLVTLLTQQVSRWGAALLSLGGLLEVTDYFVPTGQPIAPVLISIALVWLGVGVWRGVAETTGPRVGRPLAKSSVLKELATFSDVPPRILVFTAIASYAGQALALLQGWPLWAIVLAMLIPWFPVFSREMVWTYHHYHWLALFYVLVVTQGGHFMEHVVQMVQIHVLGLTGAAASGVFGALDIEWVHFLWNTWIIAAVVLLIRQFPRNIWLLPTLVLAIWHELEHLYIMSVYLSTGVERTPGLLGRGGLIGGGLPLPRPDLHFYYNLIETVPLVAAFVWQLKNSYDEWLARAFPHLSQEMLTETTEELTYRHFQPGETVLRQGELADRFYIITQGEVSVTRQDREGQEIQVATLGPGKFFGEIGLLADRPRTATVRAQTQVELLALDRETFRRMVESSHETADDILKVATERLAPASS
jgi:hypothetical protein